MKIFFQIATVLLAFVVCLPLLLWTIIGNKSEEMDIIVSKVSVPENVIVWNEKTSETMEVDFEDYVKSVVASEMPSEFEEEALKAQSVAARTYVMAKIIKYQEQKPVSHPEAAVCNTTHCQMYKTEEELISCHSDGWAEDGWQKVKAACEETKGELLYYEGEIVMQPLFFSSSGGQTENSEDVFSGAYPYLVSVESPYEEEASHANEEKTFTLKEVEAAMEKLYPSRPTGTLDTGNIKIISLTRGGRVDEIQIGKEIFKGTEVRSALSLSSTLFSIEFDSEGSDVCVVFTSSGYGHGVGMSQYGANGMAKQGKNYQEILKHYYTGTTVC